jgi:hypothetical protein
MKSLKKNHLITYSPPKESHANERTCPYYPYAITGLTEWRSNAAAQ